MLDYRAGVLSEAILGVYQELDSPTKDQVLRRLNQSTFGESLRYLKIFAPERIDRILEMAQWRAAIGDF